MIIENFQDVIRYLNGTYSSEKTVNSLDNKSFRVEREKQILNMLDNPEKNLKIIHVAGSKGKGTTVGHIGMLLQNENIRVGLYMSPHVYDYKERWSEVGYNIEYYPKLFGKEYIRAASFIEKKLKDHKKITNLLGGIPPTPFELYTAFALVLFNQTAMDYVVMETGIGGRLDATNAITPIATVITHIEKEHTNLLGNTLEDIAYEKAGIIKKGVPVFIQDENKEVTSVIEKVAKEKGAKVFKAPLTPPYTLHLATRGKSAEKDYMLAFTTVNTLGLLGHEPFSIESQKLKLPARGEVQVESKSIILLDGAHTKDSIIELVQNIDDILLNTDVDFLSEDYEDTNHYENPNTFKRILADNIRESLNKTRSVIFSTPIDKNAIEMLKVLIYHFDTICLTNIGSIYKKNDIVQLILAFEKVIKDSENYRVKNLLVEDNLDDSIVEIENLNAEYDIMHSDTKQPQHHITVITGSFYLCGDYKNSI